jgi:hypothetical protein
VSQTFRAITTGAMILGLGLPSQADEITRFILIQPLSHIREVCAHVAIPDLGCIEFVPATDNAGDVICVMRIHHTNYPWEEEALLAPLRLQCLEQP